MSDDPFKLTTPSAFIPLLGSIVPIEDSPSGASAAPGVPRVWVYPVAHVAVAYPKIRIELLNGSYSCQVTGQHAGLVSQFNTPYYYVMVNTLRTVLELMPEAAREVPRKTASGHNQWENGRLEYTIARSSQVLRLTQRAMVYCEFCQQIGQEAWRELRFQTVSSRHVLESAPCWRCAERSSVGRDGQNS